MLVRRWVWQSPAVPRHSLARVWGWGGLLVALLSGASAAQTQPARVSEERVRAVQPGVARVLTARGSGSGFLVREDGLFVTAFHVISGAPVVTVHFPSGEACEAEGLVSYQPELDVAVLKLPANRLPKGLLPVALGAPQRPEADQPMAALGYPGGKELVVIRGMVFRETPSASLSPLPLEGKVRPGVSGGPVIDAGGRAIGVIVSRLGEELGFAAPISAVQPLPAPGTRLVSLAEANRSLEGSAWEAYSQAMGVLEFWERKKAESDDPGGEDGRTPSDAIEWARTRFSEAAKKQPGFLQALVSAGVCSSRLDQYPEAVSWFRQARDAAPGSLITRCLLAYALAATGQPRLAKAELRTARAAAPRFTPAARLLAMLHLSAKEYTYAIRELRAVLSNRPDDAEARKELGEALLAFGDALAAQREYRRAGAQYRKLIELEPRNAAGHRALGRSYVLRKSYREAVPPLREAIRLKPRDPEAHYALGLAYARLGATSQARRIHQRLRQLDPTRARRLSALLRK